jgi:hypothetical protein
MSSNVRANFRGMIRGMVLVTCLSIAPAAAEAGWVAQWLNTAYKSNGERQDPQRSTMRIADGKIKVEQPHAVTLIDYARGSYTILNPERKYFWTGSIEDYITEMTKERNVALKRRMGTKDEPPNTDLSKVDVSTLPKIKIEKTDETKTIAGHATNKYVIRADEEVFQEIWLAPTLDLQKDIDLDKYLDYERKMSGFMLGKSGKVFHALYRNEEYAKLLRTGFVLETVTKHIAGGFEQVATDFKQSDIAASEFEVPETYRRVRLADLLTPGKQG